MKLTFKKQPRETGLARIAHPYAQVEIKGDGYMCGVIVPPTAQSTEDVWRVRIMLKCKPSADTPAGWNWATFKPKFKNEEEAREWVKSHWSQIVKANDVHLLLF